MSTQKPQANTFKGTEFECHGDKFKISEDGNFIVMLTMDGRPYVFSQPTTAWAPLIRKAGTEALQFAQQSGDHVCFDHGNSRFITTPDGEIITRINLEGLPVFQRHQAKEWGADTQLAARAAIKAANEQAEPGQADQPKTKKSNDQKMADAISIAMQALNFYADNRHIVEIRETMFGPASKNKDEALWGPARKSLEEKDYEQLNVDRLGNEKYVEQGHNARMAIIKMVGIFQSIEANNKDGEAA